MWAPGMPLTPETLLKPLLAAIGFGQQDLGSWQRIEQKLAERSVLSLGDLFGATDSESGWSRDEVHYCLKTLQLNKHPMAYIAGLEAACGQVFRIFNPDQDGAKLKRGGDFSARSMKVEPSARFNASTYVPDGRCYMAFPQKGSAEQLSPDQEKLYLDYLWLEAHANPEISLGDYLPDGVPRKLAVLHDLLLPPFRPAHCGTAHEKPRDARTIIALRWQNGRQCMYKRIVLDEKFKSYFGPKSLAALTDACFVPSDDARLQENERNDFFATLVKVYAGDAPVSTAHPR